MCKDTFLSVLCACALVLAMIGCTDGGTTGPSCEDSSAPPTLDTSADGKGGPPGFGCTTDDECQGGQICVNGACEDDGCVEVTLNCATDPPSLQFQDLPPDQCGDAVCPTEGDTPDLTAMCNLDADPFTSTCDPACETGMICVTGYCIPEATDPPTPCIDDAQCDEGETCEDGSCVVAPTDPPTPSDDCDPPCDPGETCEDSICVVASADPPTPCIDDAQCDEGETCKDGSCVPDSGGDPGAGQKPNAGKADGPSGFGKWIKKCAEDAFVHAVCPQMGLAVTLGNMSRECAFELCKIQATSVAPIGGVVLAVVGVALVPESGPVGAGIAAAGVIVAIAGMIPIGFELINALDVCDGEISAIVCAMAELYKSQLLILINKAQEALAWISDPANRAAVNAAVGPGHPAYITNAKINAAAHLVGQLNVLLTRVEASIASACGSTP